MNELDREVIALRNFEELSNEETAEVLQIKPSAASKRYPSSAETIERNYGTCQVQHLSKLVL